ncbi:MAG: prepilin-type N-terminal cleavage/methylation domain-containing protein [Campylobacterales bacterium]|nr:prepilin-type N-terminal cleavage/methylation domain-containing protein [Campylobacterales bacterium]
MQPNLKYRRGFTIIELLVSVGLIAIVVMGIIKLQSQTRDMAFYIANRGKAQLANTLFTLDSVQQYHQSTKDAYTIIGNSFKFDDFKSKDILEKTQRDIFISDPLELDEDQALPFKVYEIKLRGDGSASSFYRFGIN